MAEWLKSQLLRRADVERITGKSRSSIYADMDAGKFPRPVPIGAYAVGWLRSEIEAWIASRIAERDAASPRRKWRTA
jgi:prophage regulatory protein